MKKFIKDNSLSIAMFLLFAFSLVGQVFFGLREYNKELLDLRCTGVSLPEYLFSGHFIQSTFENWESEFLQMAIFVVLTIFLRQKGSSESKDIDKKEPVDREPIPYAENVPWPVKKGGIILKIYKHSLSLVLAFLFIISFVLHFYGSLKDENKFLALKGKPSESAMMYLADSRFWFESFQNWQSEFLSVFAIVVLSIFLRQKGSPQSKPVDSPNAETGD